MHVLFTESWNNFFQIFHIFNLDFFHASILWKCICNRYLVSATPPTVLYHSHWNYTDVLTIVWRYAYAFYRILQFFFFFFFTFFTFLTLNWLFSCFNTMEVHIVVGGLWAQLLPQLWANASETLQTFCLWSEDIHVLLESWNYMFFDFFFSTFLTSILFLLQYLGKWNKTNGPSCFST